MQLSGILKNPKYLAAAIAIFIVAVIIIYFMVSSSTQQVVTAGDTVEVYYTGTLTNGTVFDTNVGKQPLEFTVGAGQMIKGFDQGVVGMKLNETKTITIPANEAYGEVNPDLIIQVPLKQFGNQTVSVGMTVTEESGGQQYQGQVTAVNSDNATVDFNPPLAGQTLIFTVKLVAIKPANST
jgi:peptidylprolyl isomerase